MSLRRLILLVLLSVHAFSASAFAEVRILNLRHWTSPEHTRVVLDTSEEARYSLDKSDGKIAINLRDAALQPEMPGEFVLNKPGISRISLSSSDGGVRIELFLAGEVETNIFQLKKIEDKPARLVVDITLPAVEKAESRIREQVKEQKKDKIIVIDPGHGGDDPGAIGYRGAREKDIVLDISRKIRGLLNAGKGTRAFLTREGDYYVSFKKRLSIARELGADLFISIHADAAKSRRAKGTSVYCLSMRGASNEAARILAGKENMADVMGGTIGEEESSDESDPIILNMFQTNTMNRSKTFGARVLGDMGGVNGIKFSRVQQAPFRVLKLPEIPAVLIETAYISNPQEERRLLNDKFQMKLSKAVVSSVRDFFSMPLDTSRTAEAAVSGPDLDREKAEEKSAREASRTSFYRVKSGDTLAKIALRYGVDVASLLKMNKMKLRDTLYAGRKLVVPASEKELRNEEGERKTAKAGDRRSVKPASRFYKVKRGDTLLTIAGETGADLNSLLKLNRMKLDDTLYVGRKLKLPTAAQ